MRRNGQVIGFAHAPIVAGGHVHTHKLEYCVSAREDAVGASYASTQPSTEAATFDGYVRPDGRVGARNYIAIMASVKCSAMLCRAIADRFRDRLGDFPQVDRIVRITHSSGCGMDAAGEVNSIGRPEPQRSTWHRYRRIRALGPRRVT